MKQISHYLLPNTEGFIHSYLLAIHFKVTKRWHSVSAFLILVLGLTESDYPGWKKNEGQKMGKEEIRQEGVLEIGCFHSGRKI
jgi:hypothetical protein